jgi:hypothetical protein
MALLKPWYKVVTPREDPRESKPLDASEFAVHLDQVRDGRAPAVYRNPDDFFDRTYLTRSLLELAGQVVRRLSGERTETSAVFNLATQFGGGKGTKAALLFTLFHKRVCGPLANSLFHHQPDAAMKPASKIEAAYHKADRAIQQVLNHLAA